MQKFKLKLGVLTFLVLFSLVFGSKAALAETSNVEIIQVEIQVMPEYDTPDILLIYHPEFKNTSDQPYAGELVWNVPKGSKNHIVVDRGQGQGDSHVQISVKPGDKMDQLVWKLTTPIPPGETRLAQIEYYYNNLQGNPDKTFAYDFISEYPVTQANVVVFRPLKASNFILTPDYGQPQPTGDGFSIYSKQFSNLKLGDKVELKGSYTKSDPNPSVAPPSQQQGGLPAGQTPQSKRTSAAVVMLFLAAFVAVIGLIIYKAMNSEHSSTDQYYDDDFVVDNNVDVDVDDAALLNKKTKKTRNSSSKKQDPKSKFQADKKKLRDALLSSRISEETYHQLLAELEEENS